MVEAIERAGVRNGEDEKESSEGSEPPKPGGHSDGDDFDCTHGEAGRKLQMGSGYGVKEGRVGHEGEAKSVVAEVG